MTDGDACTGCGEPATRDGEDRGPLCDECGTGYAIPCGMKCGNTTTYDDTYGDLCFRCCRADNE